MISPDLLTEAENQMDVLLEGEEGAGTNTNHTSLSLMDLEMESTPSNSSVSPSPITPEEDSIFNDSLMSPMSPISPTSPLSTASTTTKRITRSAAKKMTFDPSHREGTPTEFGASIFRQIQSSTKQSKPKRKKRPKAPRKPPPPRKARGTKRKRKEEPLMDCPARHGLKKQLTPDNRVFECDLCNKVEGMEWIENML